MTPEELLAETATERFARLSKRAVALLSQSDEESALEMLKILEELVADQAMIDAHNARMAAIRKRQAPRRAHLLQLIKRLAVANVEPTPEARKAALKELARLLIEADAHPRVDA